MFILPYLTSALYIGCVKLINARQNSFDKIPKFNFAWIYFSIPLIYFLFFEDIISSVFFGMLIATFLVSLSESKDLLTQSANFSAWVSLLLLSLTLGYFGIALCCIPFVMNAVILKIDKEKRRQAERHNEKSGARDFAQIFSNLFPALVFSLIFAFTKNPAGLIGAGAAMAAAFADSSASDIGVLSKKPPVDIFSHKVVERGISGGVSLLGTLSAAVSSIFVSAIFIAFYPKMILGFIIISAAGFLGTLLDSALGSKLQVKYKCAVCAESTEKKFHCGFKCKKVGGVSFINNDAVNLICSFCSGLIAFIFALFL